MAAKQICTFTVEDMHLGVDVEHVQEVLRGQEMTEVPLAPAAIRGLINLRGQIVTALDMRQRLDLAPREGGEPAMNVIMHGGGSVVSLLVDSIGDVEDVEEDWFEPPPETLDPATRRLVSSVCKLDEGLLLLLDPAAVCAGLGDGDSTSTGAPAC